MKKNYARGEVIETATGYKVAVGAPIVDCSAVGTSYNNARFPIESGIDISTDDFRLDGDYLVTLEHNGESVLYRELCSFVYDDDSEYWDLLIGEDYEIVYTRYDPEMFVASQDQEAETAVIQDGDEIRLVVEPVQIALSDAFRAAIKKAYVAPLPEVYDTELNQTDGDLVIPTFPGGGGGGIVGPGKN